MKPTPNAHSPTAPLLIFGAHPDDIEFGCGGIVIKEARSGRAVHLVVCSKGESASNGTEEERVAETEKAARLMGATLEFADLDGDAHLEIRAAHAIRLAAVIRRIRPGIVLAPTLNQNQHPDHWRLGMLVRDAARLARYGGLAELRDQPAHPIGQLMYYAIAPGSEPGDISPVLIDISDPEIVSTWKAAMEAHVTQVTARRYVELQLARARMLGLKAGVEHAAALFPNDPPVFESLESLPGGARRF